MCYFWVQEIGEWNQGGYIGFKGNNKILFIKCRLEVYRVYFIILLSIF